jgi:hypothetical protein
MMVFVDHLISVIFFAICVNEEWINEYWTETGFWVVI